MYKNISGLLLFEEKRNIVSNYRILAQKYIDNGAHPKNFKNDKLKNEISLEYNRRRVIDIEYLLKNLNDIKVRQVKHHLNIRSREKKQLKEYIKSFNYIKLDKLYNYILQLSKKDKKIKIPKSNTRKISLEMGPKKGTRKKRKKRR
jgi:hypothetical protein